MTKQVRQLDRVIIRFAGDSGDGMQLTGDRFTAETAEFGNDISTLPNFPAEIRAPAGDVAGRVELPAPLRRPRHPHPRRRPERAGRDEPGRAQGEPRRPAARRRHHRQHRRVHQAQPAEGRLRQPTRSRTARWSVAGARGAADLAHRQGARGLRHLQEGRRARQEHVRPRPAVLAVQPADRGDDAVPGEQVRQEAGDRQGEHRGVPGGLELRRDHRVVLGLLRGEAGPARPRHLPEHHRQPGAGARPGRGLGSGPGLPLFLGSYPITPASDILHELSKHKRFGVAPSRPRTRSPASARRSARRSAARSA